MIKIRSAGTYSALHFTVSLKSNTIAIWWIDPVTGQCNQQKALVAARALSQSRLKCTYKHAHCTLHIQWVPKNTLRQSGAPVTITTYAHLQTCTLHIWWSAMHLKWSWIDRAPHVHKCCDAHKNAYIAYTVHIIWSPCSQTLWLTCSILAYAHIGCARWSSKSMHNQPHPLADLWYLHTTYTQYQTPYIRSTILSYYLYPIFTTSTQYPILDAHPPMTLKSA